MRIAAEAVRIAANSNNQSLAALELALNGGVGRIAGRRHELGDRVARMREECNCKVEEVLLERDGLQVLLDLTALQLSGVRNSWIVAHELLEQHRRRSAADHLWLEWLLAFSVS